MIEEIKVWVESRNRKGNKGRRYYLRWRDPSTGKTLGQAAGTDMLNAKVMARERQRELNDGTYSAIKRVTWREFVDQFLRLKSGRPETLADYKRTLNEFGEVCNPIGPHRVTSIMIEEYVQHLKNKKGNRVATVNKRLRNVRAALSKAIRWQYAKVSPMEGWAWEVEDEKELRLIKPDEKARILDACHTDQWRAFVYVLMTTGCRLMEVLNLTWSRIDLDDGILSLPGSGTKTHKARRQPLSDEAVSMLRILLARTLKDGGPFMRQVDTGRPFTKNHVSWHWPKLIETAGVPYCCRHDFRATFCTDLARLDVNQLTAQELAGHASASTTAKYYQRVDDRMKREALKKLTTLVG